MRTLMTPRAVLLMSVATLTLASGCTMLDSVQDAGLAGKSDDAVLEYALPMSVVTIKIVDEAARPAAPGNAARLPDPRAGAGLPRPGEAGAPASQASPPAGRRPNNTVANRYTMYYAVQDIADSAQRYRLRYTGSAFSDDRFVARVNADGLLTGLNATPRDQGPAVFAKVGELAVEIARNVAAFGAARPAEPEPSMTPVLNLALDPAACGQLPCAPSAEQAMLLARYGYRVRFEALSPNSATVPSSRSTCGEGICFRSRQPIRFIVEHRIGDAAPSTSVRPGTSGSAAASEEWVTEVSDVIRVANFAPIFAVPIRRSAGVERASRLEIAAGYLVSHDFAKPSEALAVIQAPIDVARSIASLPGAAIQAAIGRIGDQQRLLEARGHLLDADNALTIARQAAPVNQQAGVAQAQANLASQQKALADAERSVAEARNLLRQAQGNQ